MLILLLILMWPYPVPAVSLDDARRFDRYPDSFVDENRLFAQKHYLHMEKHGPRAIEWAAEARWRFECWDLLQDVRFCDRLGEKSLLVEKLGDLREKIGLPGYYAGVMPDCVPLWRFVR